MHSLHISIKGIIVCDTKVLMGEIVTSKGLPTTFITSKLPTTHSSSQLSRSLTFGQMSLHQVDVNLPWLAAFLSHRSSSFAECCCAFF